MEQLPNGVVCVLVYEPDNLVPTMHVHVGAEEVQGLKVLRGAWGINEDWKVCQLPDQPLTEDVPPPEDFDTADHAR